MTASPAPSVRLFPVRFRLRRRALLSAGNFAQSAVSKTLRRLSSALPGEVS
ncbi:MAG: hypothetical protein RBU37_28555 [Myxococcota bacterium]|nr:hypothetical protein [Myxococcota bacterium]